MIWSNYLIPTVKEIPADAEVPSHQLMIRAGLIRKLASGTYTYMTLGCRTVLKVIAIIREEMNAAGAQEIIMPIAQPFELWQQTGRSEDYGETLGRFKDRHGRWNVLAPTAEEVVTNLAAGEIKSYKQLPFNLYQINTKYRDEFRPRFGVIRSREFIMKDAYSFHATPESLQEGYQAMYDAYCRIFNRCGVEYIIVQAESGQMGGSGSHQFTVPCETGEDLIVYTEDGSYAANLQKAAADPLPKQALSSQAPPPQDVHTPDIGSIDAVCSFLKTKPQEMIKTLIYSAGDEMITVLVRGDHEVNQEKLTQTMEGKYIELADETTIRNVTGAATGFAGPVGIIEKIDKLLIDHAVANMAVGITGANKTDYHTRNIVPGRDFPLTGRKVVVTDLRNVVEGDTYNGKKLLFRHGIEVGQVFKLGAKYSNTLGARFLDEDGQEHPCLMGCYGIGIARIIASAIELHHDDDGIIWPISIAPFEVLIMSANQDDPEVTRVAEQLYRQLGSNNIEVLLDNRPERAGVKFKDADLIGIPVRVTVGRQGLAEGKIEIKLRRESDRQTIPIADASQRIEAIVRQLYAELS